MRLKWKTAALVPGVTPSDLCHWHMDETYVKVNFTAGRICTGRRQPGAALCRFLSPPVVTAKLHTGFWAKSSTT